MKTSILYTLGNEVYANITNHCDCNCTFCIRHNGNGVGDAGNLWYDREPSVQEIMAEMDAFDFKPYKELVYCGYGEPTCALDKLIESAAHVRKRGIKIRLNTNGTGNLYNGKDIVPLLAQVVDSVSISLNAPDEASYNEVTKPQFPDSFAAMCQFAVFCREHGIATRFTVVDVIGPEQIRRSQELADRLEIPLHVRKHESA